MRFNRRIHGGTTFDHASHLKAVCAFMGIAPDRVDLAVSLGLKLDDA